MPDPAWIQPLLTALRTTGVVSQAARQIGIGPPTVYARRKADPAFDAAVAEALEESSDVLEAEMFRRAVAGVEEPVVYQGQLMPLMGPVFELGEPVLDELTGMQRWGPVLDAQGRPVPLTINKKSDSLLMFGLKGRRKEYATDRLEATGRDGAPLLPELTEIERAARVAALVALAQQRKAADPEDMT